MTWQNLGNVAGPTAAFSSGTGSYTINAPAVTLTDQAKFRFTFGDSGGAAGPFFIDDIVITASPEFTGNYWDSDGATAGAGGATPNGTWGVDNFWSTSADGDVATGTWAPGAIAVFSAGSDATGAYTVTVNGTQDIGGLSFKDGNPTLTGGTLNMTSDSFAFVGDGLTATVASAITDDAGSRALSRTGSGTLILSGSSGSASGSMALNSGITRFDAPAAIVGTGENLTLNSGAIMAFGGSFDGTTIQTALNDRVVTSSAGTIAVDGNTAVDFDFATAGLTAAYLGAISDTTYSGLLTPSGTTYRLGGAGGKLTLSNTSGMDEASPTIQVLGNLEISGNITAVTGTLTKQNSGTLTLSGANSYNANTTASGGILRLAGSNNQATQTTINAATLQLASNSNGGLASGPVSMSQNAAVLQAVDDDRSVSNDVLLNASPTISGSQSLTINGSLRLNNNRTLTNSITGTGKLLTVAAIDRNDATDRNLTVTGAGNMTVTGTVDLGGGTLTKSGTGTLTLSGTNTYDGATTVNTGGTLALVGGSQNSVITVNSGAFLGFTLGSPTTSSKALNLNTGHAIRITGTPTLASYTLITAAGGMTGTPTLDGVITDYELVKANGNTELRLNSTGAGTPYENWAGGELFGDDANGDGVSNGLAFLLGAANPADNALGLLPTVTETGGELVMSFSMLDSASRGTAALSVEHSSDLGITDPWSTPVAVPDATPDPQVSPIDFQVSGGPGTLSVIVTISSSEAAAGKLFGRLKATE